MNSKICMWLKNTNIKSKEKENEKQMCVGSYCLLECIMCPVQKK